MTAKTARELGGYGIIEQTSAVAAPMEMRYILGGVRLVAATYWAGAFQLGGGIW